MLHTSLNVIYAGLTECFFVDYSLKLANFRYSRISVSFCHPIYPSRVNGQGMGILDLRCFGSAPTPMDAGKTFVATQAWRYPRPATNLSPGGVCIVDCTVCLHAAVIISYCAGAHLPFSLLALCLYISCVFASIGCPKGTYGLYLYGIRRTPCGVDFNERL